MNLVQKLVLRYLAAGATGHVGKVVSGDFVSLKPSHVMTHDNTAAVIPKFKAVAKRIFLPQQPVFALDHNVQDHSDENRKKYSEIRAFAKKHGVDFFPAGRGIGHQIMVEEGYAFPGSLMVGSDSHSNMYGGIGCLGTPVVRTDAASIWATGQTWWQVPPVARVILEGQLPVGVTGKDVIITLCGHFNQDEVLNHAVEFTGPAVDSLSIDDRLTIANMTTEWGALVGLFPIDFKLVQWLEDRAYFLKHRGPAGVASDPLPADFKTNPVVANYQNPRVNKHTIEQLLRVRPQADAGAQYSKTLRLDLGSVTPHVSGPNHVKVMRSVTELEAQNIAIHKAYIVSCVNGRVSDLAQAAAVLKGKKVATGVELYVAPASSQVQQEAERLGYWNDLIVAGAKPLPAGCGPCIGLGAGLLKDGEVGISATNRNFKGRMGSPNAQAYLASPGVVAASALAGRIAGVPVEGARLSGGVRASITEEPSAEVDQSGASAPLVDGFPKVIAAAVLWADQDNMNTDGIYPGKYTYNEKITPEEMARVAMENYDPAFTSLAQSGDILVSGFNFGTGSSREQAATALKHRGISLVLAGSYSTTYVRNAFNNGFLVLECPALVQHLRSQYSQNKADKLLTRRIAEPSLRVDFATWTASLGDQAFPIRPIGAPAQELVVAGGLESWIAARARELGAQARKSTSAASAAKGSASPQS